MRFRNFIEKKRLILTEWDNSPEETYADHHTMTKDLSGGINREKPKGAIRAKDPAVHQTVESSIREQLWAALNEKFDESKKNRGKKNRGMEEGSRGKKKNRGMEEGSRGKKKNRGMEEASRGKKKNRGMEEASRGKKKNRGMEEASRGKKKNRGMEEASRGKKKSRG